MLKFFNQLRLCSRVTHKSFYRPIQIQTSTDLVSSSPANLVSGLSEDNNKGASISTPFNMVSWDNSQINQQVDCFSQVYLCSNGSKSIFFYCCIHIFHSWFLVCRFFLVRMNSTYIRSQYIIVYFFFSWMQTRLPCYFPANYGKLNSYYAYCTCIIQCLFSSEFVQIINPNTRRGMNSQYRGYIWLLG